MFAKSLQLKIFASIAVIISITLFGSLLLSMLASIFLSHSVFSADKHH